MELFGWLTKGKCDVSLLDVLTLVTEIGVLFGLFMLFTWSSKFWYKGNNK
jgi:hypothetical protein